MRRDLQLARLILAHVQGTAGIDGIREAAVSVYAKEACLQDQKVIDYHFDLLANDGYLLRSHGNVQLTWSGHDLLDSLLSR